MTPTRLRPPPAPAVPYGPHPNQVANLHLPAGEGPFPAVVLVHGGFWRVRWDKSLMTPLAHDLAERGIAAWNLEYRRVGQDGGGWPGTFTDVAQAIDHLAGIPQIDTSRVVTCGHSAGGQLALWLAARHQLPAGEPGAQPVVRPRAVVAQAAVGDLTHAAELELGDGAVAALLSGSPQDVPERYDVADPMRQLPIGVPQLLVHGALDAVVPAEHSRAYARAAGNEAELLEPADADHFDVIDPGHPAWAAVLERLPRLFGSSPAPLAERTAR